MYLVRFRPSGIERKRHEADGEMEGFPRDLVPVDEGAPVAMDGYEAQRRRGAAEGAPVGGLGAGSGGGGEVSIDAVCGGAGFWRRSYGGCFGFRGFLLAGKGFRTS